MSRVTADMTPADRMVAALRDPDFRYSAEQVAAIIQLDRECRGDDPDDPGFRDLVWWSGFDAGYQTRVAEENEAYRTAVELDEARADRGDLVRLAETVDARRRADRAARLPRPGDFPGGRPVPSPGIDQDPEKEAA
jgi:hypothetical protein